MKNSANRPQPRGNCQRRLSGGRVCAYCGKDGGHGQSLGGYAAFIENAKAAGFTFKVPTSRYLDPRCASKVRELLSQGKDQ